MKTILRQISPSIIRPASFFGRMFAVLMIASVSAYSQAPSLLLPADLAVNQSTTIELKWSVGAGDSVYHIQIDTVSTFTSVLYNDSLMTLADNKISGLRNKTKYYWRVSAHDSAKAGGTVSGYSAVRSFTTWNTTPVTPLLPVNLGMTGGFAILSYAGISNTGPSVITGNVGVSPLAGSYMTGFGTPNVAGTIYGVDATGPSGSVPYASMLTVAMVDLTIAFNDAAGRTVDPIGISGNLGGRTLYSGLYKSNTSLEITAEDLTLDAQGDVNAVWIFQIASNFNMTPGRKVFLTGGARASNVFWQTGSAATFGTTSVMKGTIIAHTAVTFATGATLEGRAFSRTAAITLQSSTIGGATKASNQMPLFLGSAVNFKVLAGSRISSFGLTTVDGDIGVSPSTVITGFPLGTLTGVKHPGNATSAAAQLDLKSAIDSTKSSASDSSIASALGGRTLGKGVYSSSTGSFAIADTLKLNGEGDAGAVWIFKATGGLTTSANSVITLTNSAQWKNVFWLVGTSAVLGPNSIFRGTILASSTITANDGAFITGRLLAKSDSVVLHAANIGGKPLIDGVRKENVPAGFALLQNYPNPFNPSTMINFQLPMNALVTLKVYDMIGKEAAVLVNETKEAGNYSVKFDASHLSSGIYFYTLTAGQFTATKKLILMK